MEHARRDRPPVVGRRTHVVDRLELAGKRVGRAVCRCLVGFGAFEDGLGCGSPDRPVRHGPEGEADVGPAATRLGLGAASASTTLLMAWARRVPTLRKRSSRPGVNGMRTRSSSSSGLTAVVR